MINKTTLYKPLKLCSKLYLIYKKILYENFYVHKRQTDLVHPAHPDRYKSVVNLNVQNVNKPDINTKHHQLVSDKLYTNKFLIVTNIYLCLVM